MMPDDYTFVPNVFSFLKKQLPELHKWLIGTFGKDYDSFVAIKVSDADDDVTLLFWTAEYVFHLTVHAVFRKRGGYLGLARTARMPEVGEEHCRGADMYDGDFSEKSWNEVVRDILRHAVLPTRPPIFVSRRTASKKRRTTKAKKRRLPADRDGRIHAGTVK